jgi:hypothetical protein
MNIAEKYVVQVGQDKPDPQNPIFTQAQRDRIFAIKNPDIKLQEIMDLIKISLRPKFEVKKFEMEFVVGLLYPKLDFHVSATTNHLLKAPFNIHAANSALSVPLIDVKNFDITNCINIFDLIQGNDPLNRPKGKLGHSFMDYIKEMEAFCQRLEEVRQAEEAEEADDEQKRFEFDWDGGKNNGTRANGIH